VLTGATPPDPRSIRAIALDIDGTLITPERHVSPRTAEAIRQALARDVLVVLCTGREYSQGIAQLGRELRLHLPAILRNGAAVQDIVDGRVLSQRLIPEAAVHFTIDAAFAADATPMLLEAPTRGDALVTLPPEQCHPAIEYFLKRWNIEGPGFGVRRVDSREALYGAVEATWVCAAGDVDQTRGIYERMRALPGVFARWTVAPNERQDLVYHLANLLPANCTKATALAEFATEHGIGLQQVVAVGDHFNDVEMLKEVGWGVAMGQAPEPVKAIANAVTLDNAQDGCALAIERYVLGLS
jgi:5-amino-6-(5-phospho-D-ribitylamino)uracil phosphatase